jgi:hypothetical protein
LGAKDLLSREQILRADDPDDGPQDDGGSIAATMHAAAVALELGVTQPGEAAVAAALARS